MDPWYRWRASPIRHIFCDNPVRPPAHSVCFPGVFRVVLLTIGDVWALVRHPISVRIACSFLVVYFAVVCDSWHVRRIDTTNSVHVCLRFSSLIQDRVPLRSPPGLLPCTVLFAQMPHSVRFPVHFVRSPVVFRVVLLTIRDL